MSEANGFAGKGDLLARNKRRYREVSIGDMKVRIQSLMEGEKAELDALPLDEKTGRVTRAGLAAVRPLTIAMCVVDAEGNRIFSDEDVGAIRGMEASITDPLFDACREHCELEVAEFDTLVKN